MNHASSYNLHLHRRSRRSLRTDINSILSDWQRPGQVSLLGASALAGTAGLTDVRARRIYYARSAWICAGVLALVVVIGWLGHMTNIFGN